MTTEQMQLIIRVFQFGFSSGLTDRFEMIRQYCKGYPELRLDIIAAATVFEKGCCYCPEQEFALSEMSNQQFEQWLYSHEPQI